MSLSVYLSVEGTPDAYNYYCDTKRAANLIAWLVKAGYWGEFSKVYGGKRRGTICVRCGVSPAQVLAGMTKRRAR